MDTTSTQLRKEIENQLKGLDKNVWLEMTDWSQERWVNKAKKKGVDTTVAEFKETVSLYAIGW